jgi:hypothetical protein
MDGCVPKISVWILVPCPAQIASKEVVISTFFPADLFVFLRGETIHFLFGFFLCIGHGETKLANNLVGGMLATSETLPEAAATAREADTIDNPLMLRFECATAAAAVLLVERQVLMLLWSLAVSSSSHNRLRLFCVFSPLSTIMHDRRIDELSESEFVVAGNLKLQDEAIFFCRKNRPVVAVVAVVVAAASSITTAIARLRLMCNKKKSDC